MSREIDRLMAVEVMGWSLETIKGMDNVIQWYGRTDGGASPFTGIVSFEDWKPTTDEGQALKCFAYFCFNSYEIGTIEFMALDWKVMIKGVVVVDRSAPLAICNAILKAKGLVV